MLTRLIAIDDLPLRLGGKVVPEAPRPVPEPVGVRWVSGPYAKVSDLVHASAPKPAPMFDINAYLAGTIRLGGPVEAQPSRTLGGTETVVKFYTTPQRVTHVRNPLDVLFAFTLDDGSKLTLAPHTQATLDADTGAWHFKPL